MRILAARERARGGCFVRRLEFPPVYVWAEGWGGFVNVREVSILIRYWQIETRQALCDGPSLAGSYGSTVAGGFEGRRRGVGGVEEGLDGSSPCGYEAVGAYGVYGYACLAVKMVQAATRAPVGCYHNRVKT
jgi:hypothetical protein